MGIILVVDDEPLITYVLKKYLTKKGYKVYSAANGNDAVDKVRDIRPDMVLLDMSLPGMSSLDVLQEIKKIDPYINVIMLTGIFDEKMAEHAIQLGAFDYVTKPFHYEYLEQSVLLKINMAFNVMRKI